MASTWISAPFFGALWLLKFIWKHRLIFLIILFTIPTVVNAFSYAKETNNPTYPVVALILTLTNADSMINVDVESLKEDPSILIGMEKPDAGIWFHIKYYWAIFYNVVFRFLRNIFLILVPFIFIYRYFKWRGQRGNQSSGAQNVLGAIKWGLGLVFVINLFLVIIALIEANPVLIFPENLDKFQKVYWVFVHSLPFHGLYNLGNYLYTLFI